jgi:hypothetical protein
VSEKIDLTQMRELIAEAGTLFFDRIMALDKGIRPDDRERTGVQIFLCEPGTRNFVLVPVYKPSEAGTFFAIEKAVRSYTLGDYASQNSQDESKFKFAGCVMVKTPSGQKVQGSMSGLKPFEDVGGSMYVLSRIFKCPLDEVYHGVKRGGGRLPNEISDPNHYLYNVLVSLPN